MLTLQGSQEPPCPPVSNLLRLCWRRKEKPRELKGTGGFRAAEKVPLAPGCRDGTEHTRAVSSEDIFLNNALLS